MEGLKRHTILAIKDVKVSSDIVKLIMNLPRLKKAVENQEVGDTIGVDTPNFTGGYFLIYLMCKNNLADYLNGFCTGYLTGIKFDNA